MVNNKYIYDTTKRINDIVLSIIILVIIFPIILLAALAVKFTSPGPVFYRAKRAGVSCKPFYMFKLRTMYINTDTSDRKITSENDDRITPVGKLLRKLKIDELPQFWNVLLGDMSIVGPRPEDWEIIEKYYTIEKWPLSTIRPGIACPVDVRWYPDLTYHDPPPPGVSSQTWYLKRHLPAQVAEAQKYVENRNIFIDFRVILQTIFCVLVYSWLPPKRKPLQTINSKIADTIK